MKQRATELRAEGKKGAKWADGLQALLDAIAKMAPATKRLANGNLRRRKRHGVQRC